MPKQQLTKTVTLKLTPDLFSALTQAAEADRRPKAAWVRLLIERELEQAKAKTKAAS